MDILARDNNSISMRPFGWSQKYVGLGPNSRQYHIIMEIIRVDLLSITIVDHVMSTYSSFQ